MFAELIIPGLFSLSIALGFFWLLREPLNVCLERIAGVFGKSFSGRSPMVQYAVYGLIICAAAFLLFLLLKKLSRCDKNLLKIIVCICLAGILVLLSILCFEQVLRKDDNWEIHDAQHYGFPGFLLLEFKAVCGRYFSLLLRSMYAFFDPEQYIHVMLTVNIVCLFAACYYLARVLLSFHSGELTFPHVLTCGICLALACLFLSPKIWEVWFWGSGTFVYGVGITLAITILALYLDACKGNLHVLLTLVCITCACGSSELVTASVCGFGVLIVLINWLSGNTKRNLPLILFTLWSFLCAGFVLFFSASAGLAGYLSSGEYGASFGILDHFLKDLPGILTESVTTLWRFFHSRLEYALYLAFAAFLLGIGFPRMKVRTMPFFLGMVGCVLIAIGALTMNIFMNYVPGRVLTIPLIWLFLPVAAVCFRLGTLLNSKVNAPFRKVVPVACAALLFVPVCGLYQDSIGKLRDIHEGWRYRDAAIKAIEDKSRPITACTIPVIGSIDRDLSEDPNFEINLVTSVYYNVPAIIGGDPCPPFD